MVASPKNTHNLSQIVSPFSKVGEKQRGEAIHYNLFLIIENTSAFTSMILLPLIRFNIQSTLVISTSVISNNRLSLSRRENLVLVLTQKLQIRLQNIVEKRRNCSLGAISPHFHNIFNIYFLSKESNYIAICKCWLFKLFFPQYYKSDMSKYGYLEVFLRVPSISG